MTIPMKTYWRCEDIETLDRDRLIEALKEAAATINSLNTRIESKNRFLSWFMR